jgi:DNA-binding NtrC family response regulator
MPPLRQRADDVRLLADHFLGELIQRSGSHKQFSADAVDRLRGHSWPGTVRELRNVVERAFIMAGDAIGAGSIPLDGTVPAASGGEEITVTVGTPIDEVERRLVLATLEHTRGNKRKAAELLGISLKTLYTRLNKYGS